MGELLLNLALCEKYATRLQEGEDHGCINGT